MYGRMLLVWKIYFRSSFRKKNLCYRKEESQRAFLLPHALPLPSPAEKKKKEKHGRKQKLKRRKGKGPRMKPLFARISGYRTSTNWQRKKCLTNWGALTAYKAVATFVSFSFPCFSFQMNIQQNEYILQITW